MATKFFFVNKNAKSGSLSHSFAAEKSSINKHVQLKRKHARQDPLGLRNPAGKPRYAFAFRRKSQVDEVEANKTSSESESETGTRTSRSSSGARDFELEDSDTGLQELLISGSRRAKTWTSSSTLSTKQENVEQLLNPLVKMPIPSGSSIDPFGSQCVSLGSEICSLLRYYVDSSQPARWQAGISLKAGGSNDFNQHALQLVRGCLESDMTMYCAVAMAGGLRINQEGLPMEPTVNRYIRKAIISTKNHLETNPPIDSRLIVNIYHLCTAEWFAKNFEAARTHLKLVKQLVDNIGGLQHLNAAARHLLILGDGFFAAERLTLPVFPCDFDPGPDPTVSTFTEVNNIHSLYGQGALEAGHSDFMHEKLCLITCQLAETVSLLAWSKDNLILPPAILQWIYLRNLAIRHQLLSLTVMDRRASVFRLVLITWMIMVVFRGSQKMVQRVMAPRLQDYLSCIEAPAWRGHEGILQWVLSVGAMSAPAGTACQVWMITQLYDSLAHSDSTENLVDYHAYLLDLSMRFFYLPQVQDAMLDGVVDMLNQRKQSTEMSWV